MKPLSFSIQDAYWDGTVLNALVLAGERATGDLKFTLADWATGETVLAWEAAEDYEIGAQYLSQKETTDLKEGIYLLTSSLDNASASTLIGKTAEPEAVLEIEDWSADDGGTEVTLRDQDHILTNDSQFLRRSTLPAVRCPGLPAGPCSRQALTVGASYSRWR